MHETRGLQNSVNLNVVLWVPYAPHQLVYT